MQKISQCQSDQQFRSDVLFANGIKSTCLVDNHTYRTSFFPSKISLEGTSFQLVFLISTRHYTHLNYGKEKLHHCILYGLAVLLEAIDDNNVSNASTIDSVTNRNVRYILFVSLFFSEALTLWWRGVKRSCASFDHCPGTVGTMSDSTTTFVEFNAYRRKDSRNDHHQKNNIRQQPKDVLRLPPSKPATAVTAGGAACLCGFSYKILPVCRH